tara:strand:- start:13 stop:573 length:561 start_codon:yes stop_codon:yes gene_type:complete
VIIEQAIFKIEKAVAKTQAMDLVEYINSQCVEKAKVLIDGVPTENTSQRNVYSYGLNPKFPSDKKYTDLLLEVMEKSLKEYTKIFSYIKQLAPQDINLLKYEKDNFYNTHIDSFHTENRQLSVIINLNEDYEGGEVVFFHPTERKPYSNTNLKTGDLLIFPSNFLYPHKVTKITKGFRYSVVSWYA